MWCVWLVTKGVRTGIVKAKGFPYARHDTPFYFWVTIATYAALAAWIGYFGVRLSLDVWRGR